MALDMTSGKDHWDCETTALVAVEVSVPCCMCAFGTPDQVHLIQPQSLFSLGIFTSTVRQSLSVSLQFTGFPEKSVNWTSATTWSPSLTLTWIWITRWVSLCVHPSCWNPEEQGAGNTYLCSWSEDWSVIATLREVSPASDEFSWVRNFSNWLKVLSLFLFVTTGLLWPSISPEKEINSRDCFSL